MSPPEAVSRYLAVTAGEMAEVDRRTVDDYGMTLMQMMENAGRALARVARERFLGCDADGARVLVLAGPGGNGGGALVAARRLAGWGAAVRVIASAGPASMAPVTAHQAGILGRSGIAVDAVGALAEPGGPPSDLVLDGLLGYGGRGEPRGAVREAILWTRAGRAPVLALDVPSGLDATSGAAARATVRAAATLTLAAPKTGLLSAAAAAYVGELYLADVAVPPAAFAGLASPTDPASWFTEDDIIRLR